mmetsp:Transcript_37001/g.85397  ORF Transcript_37001/g.85397 Transcript_37001/m.85397 type:complete len:269 (-) Transcript_37001:325-1131(-)
MTRRDPMFWPRQVRMRYALWPVASASVMRRSLVSGSTVRRVLEAIQVVCVPLPVALRLSSVGGALYPRCGSLSPCSHLCRRLAAEIPAGSVVYCCCCCRWQAPPRLRVEGPPPDVPSPRVVQVGVPLAAGASLALQSPSTVPSISWRPPRRPPHSTLEDTCQPAAVCLVLALLSSGWPGFRPLLARQPRWPSQHTIGLEPLPLLPCPTKQGASATKLLGDPWDRQPAPRPAIMRTTPRPLLVARLQTPTTSAHVCPVAPARCKGVSGL